MDVIYIFSLQRWNRFDAFIFDVIEEDLDEIFQTIRYWLQ